MRSAASVLAPVLLLAAPFVAREGGTTYTIQLAASHVVVHVGRAGLFSFAGHNHEVAAPVAVGTVTVDPADLSRSSVRVEFDAASLKVTGEGEPPEDVPEVQRTMEGERVLDASRFPRMIFVSRRVEVLGMDGAAVRLRVTGDLALHGVTRPESAEVRATVGPDRLTASGTLTVKQTDFGIQPVTAGAGTVRVKNDVRIDFTIVATPVA